jgi:hypothetical protein
VNPVLRVRLPTDTPFDNDRVRTLVRLAVLAFRRTARENSARLLAAGVVVLLLADAARRVRTPHALDMWLAAALLWVVVLPAPLAGDDPLRGVRMALLPVPAGVLRRARFAASAPLRLLLLLATPILGGIAIRATRGVAAPAALLALVGWTLAAFVVGDALDERWHRPRAGGWRALAATAAALGGWCFWSIRSIRFAPEPAAEHVALPLLPTVPALLPRADDAWGWLLGVIGAAAGVALVAARLRRADARRAGASAPGRPSPEQGPATAGPLARRAVGRALRTARLRTATLRTVRRVGPRLASDRALGRRLPGHLARPRVAQEVALLVRHIGPRVALATVALLACAATYGRVPGLALGAVLPMALLTMNALGADAALGGIVRHTLLPEPPGRVRDRRLAIWALATALAALGGAVLGGVLPAPALVGRPPGGAIAAPATLCYAAALVPWFGRASWWWARRYPQAVAQRLREVGTQHAATGPGGPAHLALVLLAAWAGVTIVAGVLWAVAGRAAHVLAGGLATSASSSLRPDTHDGAAWIAGVLLAAAVAAAAHAIVARVESTRARHVSGHAFGHASGREHGTARGGARA